MVPYFKNKTFILMRNFWLNRLRKEGCPWFIIFCLHCGTDLNLKGEIP